MEYLIISIVFALAHWFFVIKENRIGIISTKPPVMIFLMIYMVVSVPDIGSRANEITLLPLWFVLGLFFGLMGDVFLMWPDRLFLPGLISFLINQVLYLIGFGTYYSAQGNQLIQGGIYIVLIAAMLAVVYYLFKGMDANNTQRMKIPVGIYAVIITLMLISALETFFYQWPMVASILVSLGALSFYISDIMNAWARFVGPITHERLKIMSTYHAAQILITIGIVLAVQFSI
ncbi:MAG: lysoplasmalogenase [Anaerolineaceae bacterium]|nr:lysoplasmalogenase [Anaerolineaceae bacterium]